MKQTEHQLQNAIMQYLRMKGWYAMRLNSGAIRSTDAKGKMRLVRLHEAGTPDLMAFKRCGGLMHTHENNMHDITKIMFLEVKVGKNKITGLQAAKMKELEEYGAVCHVVYDLEEVRALGL